MMVRNSLIIHCRRIRQEKGKLECRKGLGRSGSWDEKQIVGLLLQRKEEYAVEDSGQDSMEDRVRIK